MNDKKCFQELILCSPVGKWCDGQNLVRVYKDGGITITSIFNEKKSDFIGDYHPIPDTRKKVFSKIKEMTYKEAIKEMLENSKTIKGPECKLHVDDEGCEQIGGIVLQLDPEKNDGSVWVDCWKTYDNFEEILKLNVISEEEKKGTWLVF